MTLSPDISGLTPVTQSAVLAMVDDARAKNYPHGVIGLRGRPDRALVTDVQHEGQLVRIRHAESALAVREVLGEHRHGDWLVIVTDRDDDDLGAGVRAHLIGQRLRRPDPWEAVRTRFSATGIDPALTTGSSGRDLAAAILAVTPPSGWPAAPAGVLTRAHALGSVAAEHLGFAPDTADVLGVLRWSMAVNSVAALADLRQRAGHLLADATLDWIAGRAGAASTPIRALLAEGDLADVVPVGVVLQLLTAPQTDPSGQQQADVALARLENIWGGGVLSRPALVALARAASQLVADLVHDRRADADLELVLDRADAIVAQIQATALARWSDLLASGLRARYLLLAQALRRAAGPGAEEADRQTVEAQWQSVLAHRLGATSPGRVPFEAAVRLVRWLALSGPSSGPPVGGSQVGELARYHLDQGSWADAAVNDVFVGVDDPELSPALQAVVDAAQRRRREQEQQFATALASAPQGAGDGVPSSEGLVWYLEKLLPGAVLPLARRTKVFLLVMDGMAAATANEILADVTTRLGWSEAALTGSGEKHRAAALSVLPSITEVSRASLLAGRLVQGQQGAEQTWFTELAKQTGKIDARLFHKKGVDTTAAGWSVSHDVGAALDDDQLPLVAVVLNTIDDALDRSDPAGTVWTADAVKHLEPLLARAATAGRTVIMTADHGHVVERRQGAQKSYPAISSGRSRSATAPAGPGEVEVRGPRVLTDDHRAVLAVDETLRYGPLKAGYHGGASAAEVVVPVSVLVPDGIDTPTGVELIPPVQPMWWLAPLQDGATAQPLSVQSVQSVKPAKPPAKQPSQETSLFELLQPEPAAPQPVMTAASVGRDVASSAVYRSQRTLTGRLMVSDDQVVQLVDALAGAPGTRLAPALAAQALGIGATRLRGALTQVQQLLNVEGYAVLAIESATGVAVLDVPLMIEQFEVRR